jgi:hypothetical protein
MENQINSNFDTVSPSQDTNIPPKENKVNSLFLFVGLILLVVGFCVGYYVAFQQTRNNDQLVTNSDTQATVAEVVPSVTEETKEDTKIETSPTPQAAKNVVTVPADWKQYSDTDNDFKLTTSLALPPGYTFVFSGSEFTISEIQNGPQAGELWTYTSSVFPGKEGLKNYYSGESRRNWYQKLLDGEFSELAEESEKPRITNLVEHPLNGSSYLEITVSGQYPPKRYLYVQNGIVHILEPSSEKATSAQAEIPQHLDGIFASLKSQQVK